MPRYIEKEYRLSRTIIFLQQTIEDLDNNSLTGEYY